MSLLKVLISLPSLDLARTTRMYTLDNDVYDKCIGCVLLQEQKGESNRFVGYASRRLNEKNKS